MRTKCRVWLTGCCLLGVVLGTQPVPGQEHRAFEFSAERLRKRLAELRKS